MQTSHDTQYDEIESAISLAGIELSAAEVHGVICGAICNQMKTGTAPNMNRLITAGAEVRAEAVGDLQNTLELLLRESVEQLHRDDGDFSLLLPDDDSAVQLRLRSLADWCRGFLLGLLDGENLAMDQLSTDAAEVARDMLSISAVDVTGDGSDSEWDLTEVEEYVRVGVQLIFEEMYGDLHQDVESEELH